MKLLTISGRAEQGAVAVEFALIFGILAMLVFAIIEFGIFFSRYQVYQGAAREGARLAATRASGSQIDDRIRSAAAPYNVGPYAITADIEKTLDGVQVPQDGTPCDGGTTRGKEVKVTWDQQFADAIVLPFIPDISFTTTISGAFRCE